MDDTSNLTETLQRGLDQLNSNSNSNSTSRSNSDSKEMEKLSDEECLLKFCNEIKKLEQGSLKKYPSIRQDPEFLTRFLKTSKFNVKKATKRFEQFHSSILKVPKIDTIFTGDQTKYKWFSDAFKNEQLSEHGPPFQYYGVDVHGRHVITYESGKCLELDNLDEFLPYSLIMTIVLLDYILETFPDSQDKGFVMIEDHKGFKLKLFTVFIKNPYFMKLFSNFFSGAMPINIKQMWEANEPKIVTVIFSMMKPFLSKKMLSRMHFVGSNIKLIEEDLGGLDYTPDIFEGGKLKAFDMSNFNLEHQLRKVFPTMNQEKVLDSCDL